MEGQLKELANQDGMTLIDVPVHLLYPSPFQTRKVFNTEDLEQGIKAKGFKGAILARPRGNGFEIVYGERRWRAMKKLKRKTIPTLVMEMSDEDAQDMLLIENLQREDLDPFEEAEGIARLKNERGLSLSQLVQRLGKPKATIGQIVQRAGAPKVARDAYHNTRGKEFEFKLTHLDLIMRQPVQEDREALVKWVLQQKASTRHLESHIAHEYRLPLAEAFFAVDDDTLDRPACIQCPNRITNQRAKETDGAAGDLCTAPRCYSHKNDRHLVQLAARRNCGLLSMQEAWSVIRYDGQDIDYGYRSQWLMLNEVCYADRQRRRFKVLLKDSGVQIYLAPFKKTRQVIEIAKVGEVYKFLSERFGITRLSEAEQKRKPTESDLAKRDEKKAKKLTRQDVAAEVAEAARTLKPVPQEHLPFMWERFRYHDWTGAISEALERREIVLPEGQGNHNGYADRLMNYVEGLRPREQMSLYYEIVWLKQSSHWVEYNQSSYEAEAARLVEQLGLDPTEHYKGHLSDIRQRKQQRIAAERRRASEKGGGQRGRKVAAAN
jgi:ParB family chromosome partitioning protein